MINNFGNALDSPQKSSYGKEEIFSEISDGHVWKTFVDNENFNFTDNPANFVFGLYIDWTNPHESKIGSRSISIGVIILICFNLPPGNIYQYQNLFVYGFTPTPKEPISYQLNSLLKPLVSELQELWIGVHFTPTARFNNGCLIKASLLFLIGNITSLQEIGGLASNSESLFCAHCNLPLKDIQNIDNTFWTPKDQDWKK
ncbi:hypothetical protein O181_011939 [Austropuccinia psidii MF-1]|uniref:Uncharacterized protein n=1 Tax=Austropuccinia psidii MF-1 TaxID=1389203 RepID=A0A9Q3GMC9_9BASI|nr:hypothetical protein [Austropuccinia psidii MF-1]